MQCKTMYRPCVISCAYYTKEVTRVSKHLLLLATDTKNLEAFHVKFEVR